MTAIQPAAAYRLWIDGTSTGRLSTLRNPRLVMAGVLAAACAVVGAAATQGPAVGAAAVLAVAGILLVAHRPAIGGILLVGVVPAISGLRRGLPVPALRLSELLVVGIGLVVVCTVERRRALRWQVLDWAAVLYVVANACLGTFDLLHRHAGFSSTALGTLLGPLQFFLMYRAAAVSLAGVRARRAAIRLMLLASAPVSILALLQQLKVSSVATLLVNATGADLAGDYSYQQLARATGPFPHWQLLGGYLFVVVALGVALLLERDQRVLNRRVLAVVLALAIAALIETVSMTPMLGTLVAAVALGVWYGRSRRVLAWLAAGAVVVAILFAPVLLARYDLQYTTGPGSAKSSVLPNTVAYRYEVWTQQYVPALHGRWAAGWGPCCTGATDLPPDLAWHYTESAYITVLLRGGLLLLASFGLLMWALGSRALRAARELGPECEQRAYGRTLLLIVLLLVPMHWIEPYFIDNGLPQLVWGLAAVIAATGPRLGASRPEERTA